MSFNFNNIYQSFTASYPVQVEEFARQLGLILVEKELDPNISGGLRKVDDSYELFVNATHPLTRKRFTIAHEIGHFVLHADLIGKGVDDDTAYRRTNSELYNCAKIGKREESQANQFAAELLMPKRLIVEQVRSGGTKNTLSEMFEVSPQAMEIRLEQLRLS